MCTCSTLVIYTLKLIDTWMLLLVLKTVNILVQNLVFKLICKHYSETSHSIFWSAVLVTSSRNEVCMMQWALTGCFSDMWQYIGQAFDRHMLRLMHQRESGDQSWQLFSLHLDYLAGWLFSSGNMVRYLNDTMCLCLCDSPCGSVVLHFFLCNLHPLSSCQHDVGWHPIYQNVQLSVRSKNDILKVALFKYFLHNFSETILHWKCQLI